jgi:hypothetical protein
MTKICKKCGEEKSLEEFSRYKNSKDGFTDSCKECRNKYKKENKEKLRIKAAEYRIKNKEKLKIDRKIYYRKKKKEKPIKPSDINLKNKKSINEINKIIKKILIIIKKCKNKDNIFETKKKKVKKNKESHNEKQRLKYHEKMKNEDFREKLKQKRIRYNEKNKEKIEKNKERLAQERREHYKLNKDEILKKANKRRQSEKYKIKSKEYQQKNKEKSRKRYNENYNKNKYRYAWRAVLKRTFSYFNTKKYDKTINILGYSAEEFKTNIESKFTIGMNWENYGEWHIDHIRSIATFESTDLPSVVNALSNLRPMWATSRIVDGIFYEGNLNKGKKYY